MCHVFSAEGGVSYRVLSLKEKAQIYLSGWTTQTFLFTGLSGTVLRQVSRRLLINRPHVIKYFTTHISEKSIRLPDMCSCTLMKHLYIRS